LPDRGSGKQASPIIINPIYAQAVFLRSASQLRAGSGADGISS
jgi:hypothetical protein